MATVCRAKNRATCKIHGMGGPVERLEIDKAKAIRTNNFEEQYKIQKQIDALIDEDPNSPETEKANFFGKVGWKLFNKMQFDTLNMKTEALVGILKDHNIYGEKVEDEWITSEVTDLQNIVQNHALQKDWEHLEVTYAEANLRIDITTNVNQNGQAYISQIRAKKLRPEKKTFTNFINPPKRPDYGKLNKDLQELTTPRISVK